MSYDEETQKRLYDKVFTQKLKIEKCNCRQHKQTELTFIDIANNALETFRICSRCKTKSLIKVVLLETAIKRLENKTEILKTQIDLDRDIKTKTEKLFELASTQKFLDRLSYMFRTKTYIE
jgi:methylphosphotriester-DNA--protein-cysteine methyltransferase